MMTTHPHITTSYSLHSSADWANKNKGLLPAKTLFPIGQRGPLDPDHLAPHTLSLKLGPHPPRARGRRGEARVTCQSISDCSQSPKTTDDRVTVARPSDGPTDPSLRSRGADPALEREINKIIKDDRRARRARLRTPRRLAPTPATDVSRRRSLWHPPARTRPAPATSTVTVEGVSQLTTTPLYIGDSYSVGVFSYRGCYLMGKVALSAYSESASW